MSSSFCCGLNERDITTFRRPRCRPQLGVKKLGFNMPNHKWKVLTENIKTQFNQRQSNGGETGTQDTRQWSGEVRLSTADWRTKNESTHNRVGKPQGRNHESQSQFQQTVHKRRVYAKKPRTSASQILVKNQRTMWGNNLTISSCQPASLNSQLIHNGWQLWGLWPAITVAGATWWEIKGLA